MTTKTVIAGIGGQGVLSMGRVLAMALWAAGRTTTYLPAHGGQVRGGVVSCTVAAGRHEIASPVASTPDILVMMSPPSILRHLPVLARGGLMLVNSSQPLAPPPGRGIRLGCLPASELAQKAGNPKAANLVMLGALAAAGELVDPKTIMDALAGAGLAGGDKMLEINRQALELGSRAGSGLFLR